MSIGHEFDGGSSDGNDQVGLAMLILVDVPLAKFPLGSFIRKQGRLQILAVQFDLVIVTFPVQYDIC